MNYLIQSDIVSIVVRMLFAIICGGIIGIERGRKRQPAGLRTHMLVCLGAALVMMINEYIIENINPESDPARLGAQVISGIGFLGAGTIIVTERYQVRGLTTAAGLWASACMGLAIGIGFYQGAIIGCAFIVLIITLLNKFSKYLMQNSRYITLYLEFEGIEFIGGFIETLKSQGVVIDDIELSKNTAIIDLHTAKKIPHAVFISSLCKIDGIKSVNEL